MVNNILLAILVMAGVTYLIRVLPLVLIRREIKNRTVRSFLHYVPYVTLSVMTVPAIFTATNVIFWSALAALAVAVVLSLRGCKLPVVAACACFTVFLVELIPF
ncbi:MAG: AzlD domain-containing protein [Clostridia bacterium]|nr:AzlD domain-containing protein [Clostridia bacterium]